MAVSLVISDTAEADIEAIGDFIALDDARAAVRFVALLKERCESLATFLHAASPSDPEIELYWLAPT